MGAIVLDLRPGLGIGPFSLGNFSVYFLSSLIVPVPMLVCLASEKRYLVKLSHNWISIYLFFFSGMPICEAFAQIEQQPNIYDVVHVKYYDEVGLLELKFLVI